ncbi:MAG: PDZ domain-containing protein [Nannocystaceae bacterium]
MTLLLALACDRAPAPATGEPVASAPEPAAAPPGPAPPHVEPTRVVGDPTLWIEAVTDTLWRLEDAVLTDAVLEVVSGATPCVAAPEGGCSLGTLAAGSVLARLGLREGDRIATVAGQPVGSPTQWRDALRAARAQGLFELALVRDGATRIHRYRFRTMRPQTPRRDRIERGFDALGEAVQADGADAVVVDVAALDILADALDRGLAAECGALLGRRAGLRLVAIADVEGGASTLAVALVQALERGGPFDVRVQGPADDAATTVRVTPREGVVGPSVLTIARTSLAVDAAPEGRGAGGLVPRRSPAPGPVTELEVSMTVAERDAALADPSALASSARVVPATDGGFKLFSIRRDTVLDKLGLRNGDRVTAINGIVLDGVDTVLEQYATLRKAESLRIELDRAGERVALTVRVVP